MNIRNNDIDNGKEFDWGNVSADYARFRDIYPQEFYDRILKRGLCKDGQKILDIGTGTGVIPRNMYRYGGKWTGTDISPEQIAQAIKLSEGMGIDYYAVSTESLSFPDNSFDVITACQCFFYFDHGKDAPRFSRMLRLGGRLLVLFMAWLPFEDDIAGKSEKLILKYNPSWSGKGETMHPISIPDCYRGLFEKVYSTECRLNVHFTRESWNGRMKACRGIGASLSPGEINSWESEHMQMLKKIAPEEFDIVHYAAMAELKSKKE